MIDEQQLRSILRSEIEKFIPRAGRQSLKRPIDTEVQALLTIPEVMAHYRTTRQQILAFIKDGRLRATARPVGVNGRSRFWIHTASADECFRPGAQ